MKKQQARHAVRVLPLGDSLTQGDGNPSAYRYDLFRLYTEADIPFVFTGGEISADTRMPEEYRRHCGRCGATTKDLIDYLTPGDERFIPAWADAVRESEVVLLYIGTNDAHRQNLPFEEFSDRFWRLLDLLYGLRGDLVVYVATLRSKSVAEKRLEINRLLSSFDFAEYTARTGREVHLVDFNGRRTPKNLPTDYPPDDAHPAAEGNRKLAEMWYTATARRIHELSLSLPAEDLGAPPCGLMTNLAPTTIAPGRSTVFSATVMPANVRIGAVTWQSSDPAVASVDEYGTVTGRKPGTAEITVETVHYGYQRTATVTVAGEPFCAMAGRRVVFDGSECRPEEYTGTVEVVLPEHRTIRPRYPYGNAGTLTTAKSFALPRGFCLSFDYRGVTTSPLHTSANYLTLELGGVALTFSAGGRQMTLTRDGALLASYSTDKPTFLCRHYDLVRTENRVTLLREGLPLLDAPIAPPTDAEAPLVIRWERLWSVHHIYNLKIGG